jgi:hypothetical protein
MVAGILLTCRYPDYFVVPSWLTHSEQSGLDVGPREAGAGMGIVIGLGLIEQGLLARGRTRGSPPARLQSMAHAKDAKDAKPGPNLFYPRMARIGRMWFRSQSPGLQTCRLYLS